MMSSVSSTPAPRVVSFGCMKEARRTRVAAVGGWKGGMGCMRQNAIWQCVCWQQFQAHSHGMGENESLLAGFSTLERRRIYWSFALICHFLRLMSFFALCATAFAAAHTPHSVQNMSAPLPPISLCESGGQSPTFFVLFSRHEGRITWTRQLTTGGFVSSFCTMQSVVSNWMNDLSKFIWYVDDAHQFLMELSLSTKNSSCGDTKALS